MMLFSRMWREIRQKAKLQLFTLLVRLKVIMAEEDASQSVKNVNQYTAAYLKPASQEIFDRWKIMIDIFIGNGLI